MLIAMLKDLLLQKKCWLYFDIGKRNIKYLKQLNVSALCTVS